MICLIFLFFSLIIIDSYFITLMTGAAMFEHLTFRAHDFYAALDSIFTTIGMVVILSLALIVAILIFL